MKIKKYILSLLIGAAAFSFSSCNDFLDRDPLGQFTEDDAPNALVGGKMYNVYYLMRGYDITAGIPAFMIHMVRSEDSEKEVMPATAVNRQPCTMTLNTQLPTAP